jgi:phosphatidylserine decarboxylase
MFYSDLFSIKNAVKINLKDYKNDRSLTLMKVEKGGISMIMISAMSEY